MQEDISKKRDPGADIDINALHKMMQSYLFPRSLVKSLRSLIIVSTVKEVYKVGAVPYNKVPPVLQRKCTVRHTPRSKAYICSKGIKQKFAI